MSLLQRDCGVCPTPPPCDICSDNQQCIYIYGNCEDPCPKAQCIDNPSSGSSSSGPNKAAIAGGVIGALIFISIIVCLWFWRRRRQERAKGTEVGSKPDMPVPAATVLSRPNPNEKPASIVERNTVRVYSSSSNTTIDLDPQSQRSTPHPGYESSTRSESSNPFEDQNSIQTAGTEGTNVIPIALVAPESQRSSLQSQPRSNTTSGPARPERSGDLVLNDHLNLEHVNVSSDSFRPANQKYANSQVSGVSSRNSYMSGASYSSDFLNEAPVIMTPKRQVLGVGKAEVISAGNRPGDGSSLKPPNAGGSKPTIRSPLAATSFGPGDTDSIQEENPFSDRHTSTQTNLATSPASTHATFGQRAEARASNVTSASEWGTDGSLLPWNRSDAGDLTSPRPSSMSTQAGSVIDIASATRVNVGLSRENSGASSGQRTLYRTTMGKLVSPTSAGNGNLEDQQRAAYTQIQQPGTNGQSMPTNRFSDSTMASGISARADSILEAFPFVPPSPISNRPARTPPVSPLAKQAFSNASTPRAQTFSEAGVVSPTVVENPSPVQKTSPTNPLMDSLAEDDDDLVPPNRKTLGMSTGSQLSVASTGLGSFPFQIDHGSESSKETNEVTSSQPPKTQTLVGRQRASLDTLALTSDLSSYPLEIDSVVPPLPTKK